MKRPRAARGAAERPDARASRNAGLRKAELVAAVLLTLLAISLHIAFLTHAGPLWRDEVNSLEFARMPSLSSIGDSLQYDSFPLLATLALRAWNAAGWGSEGAGLRAFGLIVGLALLAALWAAARGLGGRAPLLSLALVGVSPLAVQTADSIRPYGLGVVLIVLTTGLVGSVIQSPTRGRVAAAGLAAVLSVQSLYPNAVLLLAVCGAGIVAAALSSKRRAAFALAGVGLAAALSLLPYVPSILATRAWSVVIQTPTDLTQIARVLGESLGPAGPAGLWSWIVAAFLGVAAGAAVWRSRAGGRGAERALVLYSALAWMGATTAFLLFLQRAQLMPQAWYFVPLLAVAAPLLDASVAALAATSKRRIARILLVIVVAVASLAGWRLVLLRRSNIDLVASWLEKEAVQGDLIVVYPWYYGVSFRRYYHGDAAWSTLPPLNDLRIHRYDLLKERMASADPIGPVLERMGVALRSGHRVWLVGGLVESPGAPADLSPAPHPTWGWNCRPYLEVWSNRGAQFLRSHAMEATPLPYLGTLVSPLENAPIIVVSGWRG